MEISSNVGKRTELNIEHILKEKRDDINMLPFDSREYKQGQKTSLLEGKFPDYMRRLCDFRQMDFEAAFDQLLTLISLEPQQM